MFVPLRFAVLIYLLVVEPTFGEIVLITRYSDHDIFFPIFLDLNNLTFTSPLQN
jgi:hypothetical protein